MPILGDTPNLSDFTSVLVKLYTVSSHIFGKFLVIFYLILSSMSKSFGSRRDVDVSEVLLAITIVFNLPISFLFLYLIASAV